MLTFLCQFFNTGFILLLVNADLREQPISFGIVYGKNGDFNSEFFKNTGNIITWTLLFNSFFPLIEFTIKWMIRASRRKLDRSCGKDIYKTKKTSIQSYINLYAGPAYMMHYKYSTILNVCFVTFMYGFGIPILFLVAVLALTILFVIEVACLFYSYRMPPMYDERLSVKVLKTLQFAPIFYLAFGYWMSSSQ